MASSEVKPQSKHSRVQVAPDVTVTSLRDFHGSLVAATSANAGKKKKAPKIRVMQWNVLADGLANDGFLVRKKAASAEEKAAQDERVKKILDRIKEAAANNDEAARETALKQLQKEFDTPEEKAITESVCGWQNRWPRMKRLIEESNPDVLVMMEVDHMEEMQVPHHSCARVTAPRDCTA